MLLRILAVLFFSFNVLADEKPFTCNFKYLQSNGSSPLINSVTGITNQIYRLGAYQFSIQRNFTGIDAQTEIISLNFKQNANFTFYPVNSTTGLILSKSKSAPIFVDCSVYNSSYFLIDSNKNSYLEVKYVQLRNGDLCVAGDVQKFVDEFNSYSRFSYQGNVILSSERGSFNVNENAIVWTEKSITCLEKIINPPSGQSDCNRYSDATYTLKTLAICNP